MYRILVYNRKTEKWIPTGKAFGFAPEDWLAVQRYQQVNYPAGLIVGTL